MKQNQDNIKWDNVEGNILEDEDEERDSNDNDPGNFAQQISKYIWIFWNRWFSPIKN